MSIPIILFGLIDAQNELNSIAYANCFDTEAKVFDEGEVHQGREAIQKWNEATNAKYKTQLKKMAFVNTDQENILTVKVSGTFDGSPIVLKYHITLKNGLIATLEIRG